MRFVQRERRERQDASLWIKSFQLGRVLCLLRNLSEGGLCILYLDRMLQYMQVVLRAESHGMEGTAITISIIALE